jgi:hypothetical protein
MCEADRTDREQRHEGEHDDRTGLSETTQHGTAREPYTPRENQSSTTIALAALEATC